MRHSACPLCGKTKLHAMRGYDAAHLARCAGCRFVFSTWIPSEEQLRSYYAEYPRISELSALTVARYDKLLDRFEMCRKTNRILDLGCGNGLFLERALLRGWEAWGTELSEEAVKACTGKGIKIAAPSSLSVLEDGSFDVVTSFEVIEHLSHPSDDVNSAGRLLRHAGLLYLTTPNFNSLTRRLIGASWNVIGYPEHLSYFTRRTIHRLFSAHHFKKVSSQTTGINPSRIMQSLAPKKHPTTPGNTGNETLREQLEAKVHLRALKASLNFFLNVTGTGESLKVMYRKAG